MDLSPNLWAVCPCGLPAEELCRKTLLRFCYPPRGMLLSSTAGILRGTILNSISIIPPSRPLPNSPLRKNRCPWIGHHFGTHLRDFKFELPSTSIRKFEVLEETISNPASALQELLEDNKDLLDENMLEDVDRFVDSFKRDYGYELKFRKAAKVAVVKVATAENRSVFATCERMFKDFEHGAGIISQRLGKAQFVIDKKVIDDPDKELSRWVVESFSPLRIKSERPDPAAVEATFSSVAPRYDLANTCSPAGLIIIGVIGWSNLQRRESAGIFSILPPGAGMFFLPCVRGWGMRLILPGWILSLCWSRHAGNGPFAGLENLPINFCMATASLFLLRMRALI